jgi:hypothetical protein
VPQPLNLNVRYTRSPTVVCELCGAATPIGWDEKPLAVCQACSKNSKTKNEKNTKETIPEYKYRTAIKIHYFISVICIFISISIIIIKATTTIELENLNTYTIAAFLAISAMHYITAQKLKTENTIAVLISILTGVILLLMIPIGTVIGIILIYSFIKSWRFSQVSN